MDPDLPYTAEYSKSNRASCKICKQKIEKDELRMGIMVQSPAFDGKIPHWHHFKCFFEKKKLALSSVAEIANFDNLRWDDQKSIKEKIGTLSANGGKKGKSAKEGNSEFSIEYAKSGRAACRTCSEKILKGEIRISKLITDTPEAHRYGPMPGWRHVDCFVKSRMELEFSDSADKLPGFASLSAEDQTMVSEKLGKLSVKRKTEDKPVVNPPSKKMAKEDKLLKAQNDLLFKMRDNIKENLSKKEMIMLLEHNNQHISAGESRLCDNLADYLVFGAVKICPECKNARPRYKIDGYRCSGNLTEWTRCQYVSRCPEREPFKIPEEFKEKYDFLKGYKYVKRDRLFPEKEDIPSAAKKGPLSNYIVSVFGKFNGPKNTMEKKIMDFGGAISQKVDSSVNFCISTENEVAKDSSKVKLARNLNIHIVSPKVLEDIKKGSSPSVSIKENLICSWGEDPILKFGIKQEFAKSAAASSSSYSSSSKSVSQKVKVMGGAAVDPESGKEDTCHVYRKKDNIYNAVLGMVDLARGTNSYYKLQILEDNKKPKFWLFRSWGRVGTTIGGNKLENMKNAADAVEAFEALYAEKTGNEWSERKKFVKQPGLFYPLDIDYGQETAQSKALKASSESKLAMPIQELVCLIFDIEAMKKAMIEFEIDLKKMPLGKLSKKQIEQAYKVLNEVQKIIVTGCNSVKILDASNRFYTLIPHDFGLKQPTLLDNEELIKSKIEMLDSLLEIEFAYNMLSSDSDANDPVYVHYKKLMTDIEVLDDTSKEFEIINTYVQNTHAETHNQYGLVLNRVFKINRHGESERYQKFKNLHNKKLLWHGSRLTNFVGILSQGLRIAPPEAPVTGYMFGKGIYFADMVSKSANYCFTSRKNPTGLLLLCEVALGDMYERKCAEYVEKLPPKTHSTKGLGMTIPDPEDKTFIGDVEVPYGKPVKSNVDHSALLYNEYIVYDVNQVNIKYLLDVTFKWRH